MQDQTQSSTERRRLSFGLLISLTIHAMLLSLAFSGQSYGLPGFGFPWQDRRTVVPDLHIVLLPTPAASEKPVLSADIKQPPDAEPTTKTLVDFAPPAKVSAAAIVLQPEPDKVTKANTVAASPSAPAISPLPAERPIEKSAPLPKPAEDLIAVAKSNKPTWAVPSAPEVPASGAAVAIPPLLAAADAKEDTQRQAEQVEAERLRAEKQAATQKEAARQEAARVEIARAEAARIEAERNELAKQTAAKQLAERQAVARQEIARQEVAKAEAAKVEAERQEIAKQAAAQQEAARLETVRAEAARIEAERQEIAKQAAAKQVAERQVVARQEAARIETARVEAERKELARQETARQVAAQQAAAQQAAAQQAAAQQAAQQAAARQAAIQIESARLAALQAEAEKRQEKLLAIGRQLNEEAARRAAALPSGSSARRGRLFGRTDSNAELVLYAEAWSRKIQLNMTFDMVREAVKQPHADPMVTVAVRSDGSVESITFVVSSGVPAIDEAIRKIVTTQANYQAFPPALVKDYDVIEIRRTWYFDTAIRLY